MKRRILFVDRNFSSRRSLFQQMSQRGYHLIEAADVIQVDQIIHQNRIDVAILDLVSLKDEALLIVFKITKTHPGAKIILLREPEQIQLSIKGMQLGAFDDVIVPVNVEMLLSKIQSAFKNKRESKYAILDDKEYPESRLKKKNSEKERQ